MSIKQEIKNKWADIVNPQYNEDRAFFIKKVLPGAALAVFGLSTASCAAPPSLPSVPPSGPQDNPRIDLPGSPERVVPLINPEDEHFIVNKLLVRDSKLKLTGETINPGSINPSDVRLKIYDLDPTSARILGLKQDISGIPMMIVVKDGKEMVAPAGWMDPAVDTIQSQLRGNMEHVRLTPEELFPAVFSPQSPGYTVHTGVLQRPISVPVWNTEIDGNNPRFSLQIMDPLYTSGKYKGTVIMHITDSAENREAFVAVGKNAFPPDFFQNPEVHNASRGHNFSNAISSEGATIGQTIRTGGTAIVTDNLGSQYTLKSGLVTETKLGGVAIAIDQNSGAPFRVTWRVGAEGEVLDLNMFSLRTNAATWLGIKQVPDAVRYGVDTWSTDVEKGIHAGKLTVRLPNESGEMIVMRDADVELPPLENLIALLNTHTGAKIPPPRIGLARADLEAIAGLGSRFFGSMLSLVSIVPVGEILGLLRSGKSLEQAFPEALLTSAPDIFRISVADGAVGAVNIDQQEAINSTIQSALVCNGVVCHETATDFWGLPVSYQVGLGGVKIYSLPQVNANHRIENTSFPSLQQSEAWIPNEENENNNLPVDTVPVTQFSSADFPSQVEMQTYFEQWTSRYPSRAQSRIKDLNVLHLTSMVGIEGGQYILSNAYICLLQNTLGQERMYIYTTKNFP